MRVRTRGFSEAFGAFVQQRRAAAGQTQLQYAARLGISSSHLAEIEAGVVPPLDRVDRMASNAGEDPAEWLLYATRHSPEVESAAPPIIADARSFVSRLPVAGTLGANGRIVMDEPTNEDEIRYVDCTVLQAAAASYVVRVLGDTAFPIIVCGDVVGVREVTTARPGHLVVVEGAGDKWLLRYTGRERGRAKLTFVNPSHPAPPDGLEIVGRAVWIVRDAEAMRRFGR